MRLKTPMMSSMADVVKPKILGGSSTAMEPTLTIPSMTLEGRSLMMDGTWPCLSSSTKVSAASTLFSKNSIVSLGILLARSAILSDRRSPLRKLL